MRNIMLVGGCLYNCGYNSEETGKRFFYHLLPNTTEELNRFCLGMNRYGALCGRCLPSYYPQAYSFNMTCISCPNVHWNLFRYVMAAYLPLTCFYIVILFFNINITSSYLLNVVNYFQIMSVPPMLRIVVLDAFNNLSYPFLVMAKVVGSVYGIWNLDFARLFYSDICLGVGVLPTLALDYAVAVYPLLLMGITYFLVVLYDKNYRLVRFLWKPFRFVFTHLKQTGMCGLP